MFPFFEFYHLTIASWKFLKRGSDSTWEFWGFNFGPGIFLGGGGAGDGCLKAEGFFGFWFFPLFDYLLNLKSEVPLSRPSSQNLHDHRHT